MGFSYETHEDQILKEYWVLKKSEDVRQPAKKGATNGKSPPGSTVQCRLPVGERDDFPGDPGLLRAELESRHFFCAMVRI